MFTQEQKAQLRNELISSGTSEEKIRFIEELNEKMEKEEVVSSFIEKELKYAKEITELPNWPSSRMIKFTKELQTGDLFAAINILSMEIVHDNLKPVEVAKGYIGEEYLIIVRTEGQ